MNFVYYNSLGAQMYKHTSAQMFPHFVFVCVCVYVCVCLSLACILLCANNWLTIHPMIWNYLRFHANDICVTI